MKEHSLEQLWRDYLATQDKAAFEVIYQRTHRQVYTLCYRILRDPELAAEAFQMGYVRLLTEARQAKAEADFLKLLEQTVRREAWRLRAQVRRQRAREVLVENAAPLADHKASLERGLHERQLREQLDAWIDQMPDKYRIPIQLRFYDGLSQREIARMLDKSDSTIMRRLESGLKKLRRKLAANGFTAKNTIFGVFPAVPVLMSPPETLSADSIIASAQQMPSGWGQSPSWVDKLVHTFSTASLPKLAVPVILVAAALLPISAILMSDREATGSEGRGGRAPEMSTQIHEETIQLAGDASDQVARVDGLQPRIDGLPQATDSHNFELNVYYADTETTATGAELSAQLFDAGGKMIEEMHWTAAEGAIAATIPQASASMIVRAHYHKTISQAFELPLVGDQSGYEIVLKPKGSLFGKVLYADTKEPVKGAKVYLNNLTDAAGNVSLMTDPDGNFISGTLPAGQTIIEVNKREGDRIWTNNFREHPNAFPVSPHSSYGPYNVLLYEGGVVYGQVRDAVTGEPIAGATVGAACFDGKLRAQTDELGNYRLEGIMNFPSGVGVLPSEDYLGTHVFIDSFQVEQRMDFELIPVKPFKIWTVDEDSNPISDALVTYYISILPVQTNRAETNESGSPKFRNSTLFSLGELKSQRLDSSPGRSKFLNSKRQAIATRPPSQ